MVFHIEEAGPSGPRLLELAAEAGVAMSGRDRRSCRIVTHLDVDDHDVDVLLDVLASLLD